jgi:hypothetical protein
LGILVGILQIALTSIEQSCDVSKNITNSGEEKDLANDNNQEKVVAKYSFQKRKSTIIVFNSKFAKKTSLSKVLS